MLIVDTRNGPRSPVAAIGLAPASGDGLPGAAGLLGAPELFGAPLNAPVTITWWPTCSARLTDVSATSRSSRPADAVGPAPVEPDAGDPALVPALAPDAPELVPEPAPPNRAFFSTKLALAPAAGGTPVVGAALLSLLGDAVSPRWRHPVALIAPCDAVAMPRWPPCGVLDVGD